MFKLKKKQIVIGVLIIVMLSIVELSIVVFLLFKEYNQPIVWKQVEEIGYSLTIPDDWETWGTGYKGVLKRKHWSINDPNSFDISTMCDRTYHTATLETWVRNLSNSDHFFTEEEARDYVMTVGSRADNPTQIIMDRELENGTTLIVAKGRFGSAPCIGSQYLGLIIDEEKTIGLELMMDEDRDDIVFPLYESITPLR